MDVLDSLLQSEWLLVGAVGAAVVLLVGAILLLLFTRRGRARRHASPAAPATPAEARAPAAAPLPQGNSPANRPAEAPLAGETTPVRPSTWRDLRSGRCSDVGVARTVNEDSLMALELTRVRQSVGQVIGVYVVADGMGGHAAGEQASGAIVDVIARRAAAELGGRDVSDTQPNFLTWLREAVVAANQAVLDLRQQTSTDMGSTLVMAVVDGEQAYVAHVGDSRAYLVGAGGLRRLTTDHSLVEHLVATRQITADEARTHEHRNVIYRTIGHSTEVEVDVAAHPLQIGDRLLLCSDGLSGLIDDDRIQEIVAGQPSPQAACDALVRAANAAGGTDNISAVVVEVVPA